MKPTIAELAQHQDQHAAAAAAAASYPLTVVVPPEIIVRTHLGDHVLDPGEKNDDNKEKDRLREGNVSYSTNICCHYVSAWLVFLL